MGRYFLAFCPPSRVAIDELTPILIGIGRIIDSLTRAACFLQVAHPTIHMTDDMMMDPQQPAAEENTDAPAEAAPATDDSASTEATEEAA